MSEDFVQRGKLLLQQRDFAEVVKVCRTGLLNKPTLVDARLLLGTALLALRRYDEVLDEMRVVGELAGDTVLVHLLRGEALLRKGEAEQAVEALAEAVQLGPKNTVARKLYAEARHKAGLDTMSAPAEVPGPASAPVGAEAEPAPAPAPPRRRRRWLIGSVVVAGVLAAGGVTTVLALRSARESQRIEHLREGALGELGPQTYAAYLRAARGLERAVAGGDEPSRGMLARLHAAAELELGVRLPGEPPPDVIGRDAAVVAVYRALAGGRTTDALEQARGLQASEPDDAEIAYLVGRARLRARDAVGAAADLRHSAERQRRPLTLTWLGEAEAAAGHVDEALAAFDQALALAPGHPAALTARARVLAASGRLPAVDDPTAPDATLAPLAAASAAASQGGDEPPALSTEQQRAAALALGSVRLARGDAAGARAAIAGVLDAPPLDLRAGELQVAALLLAGDVAGARAEAERWEAALPAAGAPRAWTARVALVEDNVEGARSALALAGDVTDSFDGLVARAELALGGGNLDGARADLDRALALRALDRSALALRAQVDLDAEDPAAAEARLAGPYQATHDPGLAAVLGEALRRLGALPRARAVLEEASLRLEAASGRPSTLAAVALSLARVHQAEGRYADAEHEVDRSLALRPQDVAARLLAAQVRYDLGDLERARADVDTLSVAAHTSSEVLILAARVHTLVNDLDEAGELLDEAARLPTTLAADVVRERARLALVAGRAADAVQLLTRGGDLPADGESCLMLLEARLLLARPRGPGELAQLEPLVADIARRFPGKPEETLARGRLQLAREQWTAAATTLAAAVQVLTVSAAPPRQLARAYLLSGEALEGAGRLDDAAAAYRDGVRIAPQSGDAALHLGRFLLARGDAAGAFDALAQAVKSTPRSVDAQCQLGEAAAALKRPPARQALEACLKLAPNGPNSDKARKLLRQL